METIQIDKLKDTIKKTIRNERIALELTQKEFAQFIGLKYTTYRTFEQTGVISLENYLLILCNINKEIEFQNFLDSFEFDSQKQRAKKDTKIKQQNSFSPIISASQKQIILDKNIFGEELFYSVQNGHEYNISNFITIILSNCDDKKMILLIKYFGIDRLKPYILKQKNLKLLKMFNKHIEFIQRGI
jgi:transcriptional regulator with XRE-family HTH domain